MVRSESLANTRRTPEIQHLKDILALVSATVQPPDATSTTTGTGDGEDDDDDNVDDDGSAPTAETEPIGELESAEPEPAVEPLTEEPGESDR